MDYAKLLPQVESVVRAAGEIVLSAGSEKGVLEKSGHTDLVTRYDSAVQAFLQRELLSLLPEAGFLGEEDVQRHTDWEYVFIVDPIDGTTNFIKDFRHSGISVALSRRGEIVLGVVGNPYSGEVFSAVLGGGAACNGADIRASDCALEDGIFAMGSSPYYRELADRTFAIGRQLFDRSLDLRRTASAALDLCYVAAGRLDCYFECLLSPWDYAAGSLIAQEAGALATDLEGKPLRFDRKCSLAAGNPSCHTALLEIARQHM